MLSIADSFSEMKTYAFDFFILLKFGLPHCVAFGYKTPIFATEQQKSGEKWAKNGTQSCQPRRQLSGKSVIYKSQLFFEWSTPETR